MCHDARRNSPSVAVRSPTSACIRTTSRIASSSMPRSSASSISPAACRARASSRFVGRRRLPTWSARNGRSGGIGHAPSMLQAARVRSPRGWAAAPLPSGASAALSAAHPRDGPHGAVVLPFFRLLARLDPRLWEIVHPHVPVLSDAAGLRGDRRTGGAEPAATAAPRGRTAGDDRGGPVRWPTPRSQLSSPAGTPERCSTRSPTTGAAPAPVSSSGRGSCHTGWRPVALPA